MEKSVTEKLSAIKDKINQDIVALHVDVDNMKDERWKVAMKES